MDVKLPKLGEGADTGTVVNVLVQEGDRVEEGQVILELENEKAVAPIPSSASGRVRQIRVKVGDSLSVGQVILVLDDSGRSGAAPAPAATAAKAPSGPPAVANPADAREPGPATVMEPSTAQAPVAPPSIRKLARDIGLDLARVRGTGPGGRIGLEDVRAFIQSLQRQANPPQAVQPGVAPARVESIDFSQWGPVTKKPLTPLRQTISRRMTEHWNSIPHVTQFEELDITTLNELRQKHAAAYEETGSKLTLTPLVVRAVVQVLRKHPIFNASLDEATQEIVYKDYYHIGLAVDTEAGLLVPIVRDADRKSLSELAHEIHSLAERARARKLSLEEMRGGTFTISNQGGIGGSFFTPIINKPEVAILGLGRGREKAVVVEGRVVPRLLMPIGLSYDHRLIDGGTAARFTVDLAQALHAITEKDVRLT